MLIIDEEHENSYKSELSPRYDAREVARKRGEMEGAMLVLGSATPSLETYTRAVRGEYDLYKLTRRAKADAVLPTVEIADLREELKAGNRSIFSARLKELLEDRLEKGEQAMLFINRRGYATFVSCRSCGEAVKCPHCDVTLTYHKRRPDDVPLLRLYYPPAENMPFLWLPIYCPFWYGNPENRRDGHEDVSKSPDPAHGPGYYF